jgi:hypothetical protein
MTQLERHYRLRCSVYRNTLPPPGKVRCGPPTIEGRGGGYHTYPDVFQATRREFDASLNDALHQTYSVHAWLLFYIHLGILYPDSTAYPVIFQQSQHWSQSKSGLSFIETGTCMALATASCPWVNDLYGAVVSKIDPEPKARLPRLVFLALLVPVALFCFD